MDTSTIEAVKSRIWESSLPSHSKFTLLALHSAEYLEGQESLTSQQLAERMDCDSKTVQNRVRPLLALGLISRTGSKYTLNTVTVRDLGPDVRVTLKTRIDPAVRASIYQRDHHTCIYCGSTESLSLDHLLPKSRGGSDDPSNLVTACLPCNTVKNARTPEEWLGGGL